MFLVVGVDTTLQSLGKTATYLLTYLLKFCSVIIVHIFDCK